MSIIYTGPGASGAALALGPVDGWTFTGTDFEAALDPALGRVLRLTPRSGFVTSISKASPGGRLALLNTANVNTLAVAGGGLTIQSTTTTTVWTDASQTAGGVTNALILPVNPGRRVGIIARLSVEAGSLDLEGPQLALHGLGAVSDFIRIGVASDGVGGYKVQGQAGSSAQTPASLSQKGAWFCAEFAQNNAGVDVQSWYANNFGAGIPTSGWTLYQQDSSEFNSVAIAASSLAVISKGSNVDGLCTHWAVYEVPIWARGLLSQWPGQQWARIPAAFSDIFDTSAPVASIVIPCAADAIVTDATLRTALQRVVLGYHYAPEAWTFRAKRGASPSGGYSAAASLSQEATAGQDLYIDAKADVSAAGLAGAAGAALGDIIIPL